jgi:Type II secretion system (T2SS), protein G
MRYRSFGLIIFFTATAFAASKPSRDLMRTRISSFAHSDLAPDAIEIRRVTSQTNNEAIAETRITLAFQFKKDNSGVWTVDAVRLGDRDWMSMNELLAAIYNGHVPVTLPVALPVPPKSPSPRDVFHINNSDFEKERQLMVELGASPRIPKAIEIRRVISSNDTRAIAESAVTMSFRFTRLPKDGWVIGAARLGDHDWVDTNDLLATLNEGRRLDTVARMNKLASGVRKYRSANNALPSAKDIVELTNILHPVYMSDLIRVDGWGQPFEYTASGSAFRLASKGADGRWGTTDDITLDGRSSDGP